MKNIRHREEKSQTTPEPRQLHNPMVLITRGGGAGAERGGGWGGGGGGRHRRKVGRVMALLSGVKHN